MVTASAPRSPVSSPETAPPDRFVALRGLGAFTVTYEQMAYAVLLVAAVLTRFWDLGSRAMHHDESLHAWFSYQFAIGKGYQHDPLLHGPFLYHFGALIDVLFGVSEATARFGPAIFGVGIVMLPILLRPVIGRWAALICSTMLLVNPAVLYYSRLIRQDVYMMGFALLLIIAIVRYVHAPRPLWVYVAFITLALMHTTHEAAYIVLAIYGAFFFLVITWRAVRPLLAALAGWFALLAVAMVVPRLFRPDPLPEIPWDASKGQLSWASWGPYLRAVFTAPQVLAPLVATVIFVCVALTILMTLRAKEVEPGTSANDRLFGGWPAGSIIERLHGLLRDRATLAGAAGAALVIWTLLYTTLFTNLGGVFSGFAYSLIYWAGQHDVHRGGQPIYYYAFLFPFSGPISCFMGLVASGTTLVRFAHYLQGRRAMTTRFFAQILICWYGTGMFFALTWAGERMPWLICHVIVPFTVLVASYLGEAVEYLTARWRAERDAAGDFVLERAVRPAAALGIVANPPLARGATAVRADSRTRDIAAVAVAITFLVGWFFAMNHVTDDAAGDVRFLFLVGPLGLLAGFWFYARQFGGKRAVSLAAISVLLPALLFEMHLAWHLAYFGGDVPTDMLVYTQTAPDIARMQGEINALSTQLTGNDHGLVIMDSTSTVWPMNWYLRDYIAANRVRSFGNQGTGPVPDDVAFVMVGNEDFGAWEDQQLTNFQRTDYVMRWWYPEEYYRAFTYSPDAPRPDYPGLWMVDPTTGKERRATWGDTIAKAITSIVALGNGATEGTQPTVTTDGQPGEPIAKITPAPTNLLWRYFALREPPQTIGSFNFRLYVRNDLVPAFNGIRY